MAALWWQEPKLPFPVESLKVLERHKISTQFSD